MNIAIDISQIAYQGTGVARFTQGLVHAILENDTRHHWTFFYSSLRNSLDKTLVENIHSKNHTLKSYRLPPTALDFLWNTMHTLPVENLVGKQDWYISSDWTEPPSKIKKATIVHDLTFVRYPETVDNKILEVQKKRLNWIQKESSLIFADSQATKTDLLSYYPVAENKVHVIYPGVMTKQPQDSNAVKNKYNITKRFILSVGKIEPRKNLKKLIEAFSALHQDEVQLVIVGPPGWEQLDTKVQNVSFLGYVNDEELSTLYSSCLFFIFPSIWEGFGFPAVEAMQLKAPVALSNTSSLKEIGHDAALLFDPTNTEDITKTLATLIQDEDLRTELSLKGFQKSKQYNWKNYYDTLIQVLENNL